MEATAVSIGKSVLNGALGYAKSAVAEEVALQLGVQHDKSFVTGELEMMHSFLMVAHDERDDHSRVMRTWVKQVRDVAYDVEDSLQDFVIRLQKHKQSWWRIPCTLLDRRHVAKQMKHLRAKVEDVSQRNIRYNLIKGSSSTEPAATASAMFGVDEARHTAKQHQSRSRLDLAQLISKEGEDLGVIGVWGTSGSIGHTSIIWEAYEHPNVKLSFPCRAWMRVTCPLHPTEFVSNMVKQFHAAVGVGAFLERGRTDQELAQEFNGYVNEKRYLIVLTDVSTIEEWHMIKTCFLENKLGSRVIVSTEQVEVASLCAGQGSVVSELRQLSAHQTIYAFYEQSFHDATYSSKILSSSAAPHTENEIQEDQSNMDVDGNMIMQERLTRTNTSAGALEEFQLVGREKEKIDITELILQQARTQQFQVIVVWGMGGLGKTTLIKDIYHRQDVSDMFGKHAFVTVLRPFKPEELLRSLALQLDARKGAMDFAGDTKEKLALMGVAELTQVLARLSEGKRCLIVFDDLSSTTEWDMIVQSLLGMKNASLIVVITTRREDTANHCCKKPECIRLLRSLRDKDACELFTRKVFKNKTTDLAIQYPELVEPAKLILKKCAGLPLAIVTIGGFLADQPTKTTADWRKVNEHISVELEMNPMFEPIKTVLMKSYDGLPYYLKPCFLYMSIFPEDRSVSRRRLVCRWIAEGYSRDRSIADRYFIELVERSMILPTRKSVCSIKGYDSFQLHDLIRDIIIAESMGENLVFRLEEGCSLNTHGAVRHLAISSNWEGDEREFESTLELSRIRSLTVFGKCKPFYISHKMRFLRVLDLEETKGLKNLHLEHIGKLLHLRYLSLRWRTGILYLPDSVGNLRQLETLNIKGTKILMLPKTIIKLSKLRYLKAGNKVCYGQDWLARCPDNCPGLLTLPCCVPRRSGSCAPFTCCVANAVIPCGVKIPIGFRKLKSLHMLQYVHLASGNAAIQEIKGLTGLRRLGVYGINPRNGMEFCSAISGLSCLESLSVRSAGADLYDCLCAISSPPENLQSLKLQGKMDKLPKWINRLQSLVKLILEYSNLSGERETMLVLGNLPNLSILRLSEFQLQIEGPITFQSGHFRSLVVLEIYYGRMEIESLEFEPATMPKLEVLSVRLFRSTIGISGLEFLPSIKEVRLDVAMLLSEENEGKPRLERVRENIGKQLASNQNQPILKVELDVLTYA